MYMGKTFRGLYILIRISTVKKKLLLRCFLFCFLGFVFLVFFGFMTIKKCLVSDKFPKDIYRI